MAEPQSTGRAQFRSSVFKFYIHDAMAGFRLQLIGSLSGNDVPELRGCWQTARPILGARQLILDLQALKTADEAGREWLLAMVREGAACEPETYFRNHLVEGKTPPESVAVRASSKLARLAAIFRGDRDLDAEPSTRIR